MNYPQSQLILDEIKKANKILLNCHRNPDPDSIGSALAVKCVLKEMGKETTVVCPTDELYENVNFLKGYDEIKINFNFKAADYSLYDLFIVVDSASWSQVSGFNNPNIEAEKLIVIDHHLTNEGFGNINLVDSDVTSTAEILYSIFEDWGVKLDSETADCLMAGIVGDTGAFRYPGAGQRTFFIAGKLMELGADKDRAIHQLYRSEPYELIKFYGEVLSKVEIDRDRRFVWAAISYETYEKLGKPVIAKESSASMFTQVVKGTDFGFVALEQEKNKLSISLRSRNGFDTSEIAVELGGGGHIYASGARIDLPFEQAVEKLLQTVRRIADENKS